MRAVALKAVLLFRSANRGDRFVFRTSELLVSLLQSIFGLARLRACIRTDIPTCCCYGPFPSHTNDPLLQNLLDEHVLRLTYNVARLRRLATSPRATPVLPNSLVCPLLLLNTNAAVAV